MKTILFVGDAKLIMDEVGIIFEDELYKSERENKSFQMIKKVARQNLAFKAKFQATVKLRRLTSICKFFEFVQPTNLPKNG